ncbi:hypothetical protein EVAR_84180_1 [Eumeta japonica]|uniref:Uncharacterized protein n=1 Tax=Eumeta variegata TaxID=151549 RepID=A0A4C1ZZB3_EUMVA|nr:hypothetical protein EVAR_84180_1 [Eumeta japonica]
MSRRVTETMPRRDEVPPQKGRRGGWQVGNWRPGKGKAGAAKTRQTSNPDLSLEAGEGSIEMPRQTETPEGASVAPVGVFEAGQSLPTIPLRLPSTRPPIQSPASRSQRAPAGDRRRRAAPRRVSLHHILEVEREKTKGLATLRRLRNDCKDDGAPPRQRVETAVANMAAEIEAGTIDRMDIPNKLEGLRKTLEIKPTTYAAAAAKPKLQAAAKPQVPGPKIAAAHTLIVSSRCANTSDQVVKAIREVVDAREMGVGWINLQVSKPEPSPLIIIRDVLKVNSDAQIVESLKRQNGHHRRSRLGKGRGASPLPQTCAKPLECHPVLEVSPALYTRLIKTGYVYVGCSGDRFGTSRL